MEKQTDSPDVATPTTTSSLPNTSTVAWSNSPPYLSSRIPQAPFLCSHQKLPTCSPRTDEEEGEGGDGLCCSSNGGVGFSSASNLCHSQLAITNDVSEDTHGEAFPRSKEAARCRCRNYWRPFVSTIRQSLGKEAASR